MLTPHVTLSSAELSQLRTARVAIPVLDAAFHVTGPGTFSCLQGLLTNDVSKLADHAAAWGAFLTPKGMIISDAWVIRDGDAAWVVVPGGARETMHQLFARTMPPRLARVQDRSDTMQVHWLTGGVPAPVDDAVVARPEGTAPFTAMLLAPDATRTAASLAAQRWHIAPASHADALRVMLGWPMLGREIDERTLPQEVRFDELGGVKYDKGCYTGQETVARLHFRGHANRALRALRWAPGAGPVTLDVQVGDKISGTVRTIARLGPDCIALAVVRREISPGDRVRVGDDDVTVLEFPLTLGGLAVG